MATCRGLLASLLAVTALARQEQAPASVVTPELHRRAPFPVPLKVCCVGDSITSGIGSTGDNEGDAWRRYLYDLITQGGYRINQIINLLEQDGTIAAEQPNLVIIHAGTNDNSVQFIYQDEPQPNTQNCVDYTCIGNAHASETWADAPNRLGNLIDYVLCNNPNAVVLVSILIQSYINATQGNLFNAAVPEVVASRYEKGFKVRLVDQSSIYPSDDNNLHPTNPGYQDMANRFYAAMLDVPSSWWTASNAKGKRADSGPVETCDRNSISFTAALGGANVAAGWHVPGDPGAGASTPATSGEASSRQWVPQWGNDGDIAIGTGYPGSGVRLADLDGLADYIWVNTSDASFRAWLNGGRDAWFAIDNANEILWGTGAPDYVEFVDLTGDKRAEYVVVQNGAFRVFVNGGKDGNSWSFKESVLAGQQLTNAFGSGGLGLHYFGDLNGDKLADLAILRSSGVVDFYIQQGTIGTDSFSWSPCLNHAELTGSMDLVDIDGDGRADYVSMADDGSLSGWLNTPGGSCDITWAPINGRGPDSLAFSKGVPASQVRLADLTGDGKADYVTVTDDTGELNLYPNNGYFSTQDSDAGTGGIGGYGAAVRLADINADGKDDYLSVDQVTGVLAYLNEGQQGNSWSFAEQNNGAVIALGYSGASRSEIQFVDLDANGYADFVMINASTGALHTYLNFGPTDKGYNFEIIPGEIAIGVGGIGAGVRLADMTGSGRADYIYLDDAGAARIWVNNGNGSDFADLSAWVVLNNGYDAAIGVGAQRQDVHFFDVDGDGLADYIWVHPDDGSVSVWYNDGPLNSALGWISGGTIQPAMGIPGQNIRFARIGDSGRADIVALAEDGSFKAWLSTCSKVVGSSGKARQGGGSGQCNPTPPLPAQSGPEAPYNAAADAGCITAPSLARARDAQAARASTATLLQERTLVSAPPVASHAKVPTVLWPVAPRNVAGLSAQHAWAVRAQAVRGIRGANCPGSTAPTSKQSPTTATAPLTVYQSGGAFNDHPATAAPATGCAIVYQQATTITEAYPQTTDYDTIPAGPYCTCAGDETAGAQPSTNNQGTVYLYCATGITTFATSGAQATVTPTGNPGSPDNPAWAYVPCDYGSLGSRYNNRTEQWDDAGASAAWKAVTLSWNLLAVDGDASDKYFSDYASDFFHAPIVNCGDLGGAGCDDFISCGQYGQNADVNSPAGYIIINSFVAIHAILNTFYANVQSAQSYLGGAQLGDFADHVQGNADNCHGQISDAFSYDELSLETQNLLYEQNSLALYASFVTERWENSTRLIAAQIFNSTDKLAGLVNNGAFFAPADEVDNFNQTQALVAALYANLLPIAWQGGPYLGQPFILNIFAPFKNVYTADNEKNIKFHLDSGNLASETCFINPSDGVAYCPPSLLNGTAGLFGGLDIQDVTSNAVNNYLSANYSNDFTQQIPLTSLQDVFALDNMDIVNFPGLVQLPICGYGDILYNLVFETFNEDNGTAWPCADGQGYYPYYPEFH
ncbi:hypothetical protein PRZ48_013832 [Zasmidium cellare]|uniref:SGNH hydrolase-type esterase domain-containing protein n=1 Tax=Zasmidium cellare TaxID=395010 RepID=A0ABR0E267_ZASCE|nr:hypothetical protein PRZ48_013832 [Zasmidium cellare]